MSAKRKNRQKRKVSAPSQASVGNVAEEEARIDQMLLKGCYKSALDRAKVVHKQVGSPASETLLANAYAARIEHMSLSGLAIEAQSLLEIAVGKCPATRSNLEALRPLLSIRAGNLQDLCRPLLRQDISSQEKKTIEDVLRKELHDPRDLIHCPILPENHPLRVGALAVWRALEAVTTGPVEASQTVLPEISRHSPLAPWKILVRAIARFYQGDNLACKQLIEAIDADSAPARLIPVLQSLLDPTSSDTNDDVEEALVARIQGNPEALRSLLKKLDSLLNANHVTARTVCAAIEPAVAACSRYFPTLLVRLKQHISIRCSLAQIEADLVTQAMKGHSRRDAYFFRLLASAEEYKGRLNLACLLWNEFRRNAIYEGWFAEKSPESAATYMRIAPLLREIENNDDFDETLMEIKWVFSGVLRYYDQPQNHARREALHPQGEKHDLSFFDPVEIFRLACEADPTPENFQLWLNTERQDTPNWKRVDMAATAWSKACPDDPSPLLILMESAESRNALKKALGYLEAAEAIDSLNPEVGRARLRLLASTAIRHLKQNKPHLARKDLCQMEPLPLIRQGDRLAILSGAKWVCAVLDGATEEADQLRAETIRLMESELSGDLVLRGLVAVCRPPSRLASPVLTPNMKKDAVEETATAVARALAAGSDMGLTFPIDLPPKILEALFTALHEEVCPLKTRAIRALTESALNSYHRELAYTASGAGLKRGGADMARFLLLRARAQGLSKHTRKRNCLRAAIELARGNRDMDLVDEAISEIRSSRQHGGFFSRFALMEEDEDIHRPVSHEQIQKVIEREIENKKYPTPGNYYDCCDHDEDLFQTESHRSPFPEGLFDSIISNILDDDDSDEEMDDDYEFDEEIERDADAFFNQEKPPVEFENLDFFGQDFEEFIDNEDAAAFEDIGLTAEEIGVLRLINPEIAGIMQEILDKHGSPDGTFPSIEDMQQLEPELFRKLQAYAEILFPDGADGSLPFDDNDTPFPSPSPRKKRKGKRRK